MVNGFRGGVTITHRLVSDCKSLLSLRFNTAVVGF